MEKLLYKIKKLIPRKLFKVLQPAYHFLLSWLAAFLYCRPSEKIIVVGVAGTTGKTTSVYLIAKMLESAGYKAGYTSTAMFNDGKKEWLNDKKMTMVGRLFTQRMLRQMVKNKCQYAIIETTSEGIIQNRHRFINYDILVFTGLYPEHIDSHGGFANYKEAKGKLFQHLKRCQTKYVNDRKYVSSFINNIKKIDFNRVKKTIIVNYDDKHKDYFLSFWAEERFGFTKNLSTEANNNIKLIKFSDIKVEANGTSFITEGTGIKMQLLGDFNVANVMAAISVGLSQNLEIERIKRGIENVKGVPGRIERIDEGQNFTVIVDYAFEPRAVEKLYKTIKLIPHNKVIHVLGSAGGGRDMARRPQLGKIAGKKADIAIITDEDPYDEDPRIIIDQVAIGAEHVGKKLNQNLFKISDRREAIKKALAMAEENDIVLITGKGSEQAICVKNGEKITWDDRGVVRGILGNRGK